MMLLAHCELLLYITRDLSATNKIQYITINFLLKYCPQAINQLKQNIQFFFLVLLYFIIIKYIEAKRE